MVLATLIHEGDLIRKCPPSFIIVIELLVIHTTFISKNHQNVLWPGSSQSMVEKSSLLGHKPLPQVVISAVSKTADKMGYLIILFSFDQIFLREFYKSHSCFIVHTTFNIDLMLSGIFINFV